MDDNQNKNNGIFPKLPQPEALWASWSVFLGAMGPVSYTHLDVYKRQLHIFLNGHRHHLFRQNLFYQV